MLKRILQISVLFSTLLAMSHCGNGGGYGLLATSPKIQDAVFLTSATIGTGSSGSGGGNSSGSGVAYAPTPPTVPWPSGKSKGYCETAKALEGAWKGATNADRDLCILGSVEPAWHGNLTDGNYHYLATSTGPFKVNGIDLGAQMRVMATKSADGRLAGLRSTSCATTTTANNNTVQIPMTDVTFIRQDPTVNNQSSLLVKTTDSRYFVVGKIDDAGHWLEKKTVTVYGPGDVGTRQSTTLVQTPADVTISSWLNVGLTGQGAAATVQLFATAALTGETPATYSLGNGAAKIFAANTNSNFQPFQFYLGAWTGSTMLDVASPAGDASVADYFAKATAADVSGLNGNSIVVGFDSDVWDCTTPSGKSVEYIDDFKFYQTQYQSCLDTYQDNSFVTQFAQYIDCAQGAHP